MQGPTQKEENQLIERIATGDQVAFTALFETHHQHLGAFIFSITKSKELAEEITLDVFLKIWMSRETLSEVKNFKAYLFAISRNAAISCLRKVIRERTHHSEYIKDPGTSENSEVNEKEVFLSLIDEAISQLSPQRKKIYLLSRQDGLKYDEIGEQLSISKFTVRAHIQQAVDSISTFVKSRLGSEILMCFVIINFF